MKINIDICPICPTDYIPVVSPATDELSDGEQDKL